MVVRENRYSKPARPTTKTVNLSGVERMIMEQGQVGRDGRFSLQPHYAIGFDLHRFVSRFEAIRPIGASRGQ